MNLCSVAAIVGIAAFAAAAPAAAQVPSAVTVDVPQTLQAGDSVTVVARMHVTLPQCPASPIGGKLTLNGLAVYTPSSEYFFDDSYRSCANGVYTAGVLLTSRVLSPGAYTFSVDYSGAPGIGSSSTGPVTIQVMDGFAGTVGQGAVKVKVSGIPSEFYCPMHSASVVDGPPPGAPAGFSFPSGYASYAFTGCKTECTGICPPPPDDPAWAGQTITLQLPQPPAPGSKVLVYAPGGGITTPIWRAIDPEIDGSTVKFVITGNGHETELRGLFAIASGDAARSDLQDLWWGGPEQNGWGLDIAQQGDRIFAGLFAYRGDGKPIWVVMPGGTWDATHTVFSGTLYGTTGSSFSQYDPSRLQVLPSGTAKLTFSGSGAATFDYTLGTTTGSKSIVRQPIGATARPLQGPHAGLWWGGSAQNGWGVTIAHQDDTLFAVWYTYDLAGTATWFVMSGGHWLGDPTNPSYVGTLYRTTGSPFLGGTYDPSKLVVTPAGQMGFTFYGPDVARMTFTVDGQSGRAYLYKQPF